MLAHKAQAFDISGNISQLHTLLKNETLQSLLETLHFLTCWFSYDWRISTSNFQTCTRKSGTKRNKYFNVAPANSCCKHNVCKEELHL